jgi:hypothetical protein
VLAQPTTSVFYFYKAQKQDDAAVTWEYYELAVKAYEHELAQRVILSFACMPRGKQLVSQALKNTYVF